MENNKNDLESTKKECPYCNTKIPASSLKCSHCGSDLRNWVNRHPAWSIFFVLIFASMIIQGAEKNETTSNTPAQSNSGTESTLVSETPTATSNIKPITQKATGSEQAKTQTTQEPTLPSSQSQTETKTTNLTSAPQISNQNILPVSNENVSQTNALKKAKSYLAYSAFSHDGLVAQLESEQFSHADAVYGSDHSGANWSEQAVRKAKSYLSYSAFSHDGLVDQLESEQFSHSEAVYGSDNSGANWNEQAVKKAKQYMNYSAFSRGGLIEQLLSEKFTREQAEYGTNAVGL